MPQRYAAAGIEPPLEELLHDPITCLLMRRDGIDVADVRRAVAAGRSRLPSGMEGPAPEPRGPEAASGLRATL